MTTREANAFQRLKARVCRPEDRFQRVETGLGVGWPDVNYCMSGVEGWIELKAPIAPARESTPLFGSNHKVSQDQSNWFLAQKNARGRAFLFIATEERLMLIGRDYVADRHRFINTATISELLQIAAWRAKPPSVDPVRWQDLREMLTS